mmetsp:Transcript_99512/g.223096  ORF Transcript_99512/g.223096 Transcript_99512/m.223096 type:complete len:574 (+) Transcript_99512:61-1782(+)
MASDVVLLRNAHPRLAHALHDRQCHLPRILLPGAVGEPGRRRSVNLGRRSALLAIAAIGPAGGQRRRPSPRIRGQHPGDRRGRRQGHRLLQFGLCVGLHFAIGLHLGGRRRGRRRLSSGRHARADVGGGTASGTGLGGVLPDGSGRCLDDVRFLLVHVLVVGWEKHAHEGGQHGHHIDADRDDDEPRHPLQLQEEHGVHREDVHEHLKVVKEGPGIRLDAHGHDQHQHHEQETDRGDGLAQALRGEHDDRHQDDLLQCEEILPSVGPEEGAAGEGAHAVAGLPHQVVRAPEHDQEALHPALLGGLQILLRQVVVDLVGLGLEVHDDLCGRSGHLVLLGGALRRGVLARRLPGTLQGNTLELCLRQDRQPVQDTLQEGLVVAPLLPLDDVPAVLPDLLQVRVAVRLPPDEGSEVHGHAPVELAVAAVVPHPELGHEDVPRTATMLVDTHALPVLPGPRLVDGVNDGREERQHHEDEAHQRGHRHRQPLLVATVEPAFVERIVLHASAVVLARDAVCEEEVVYDVRHHGEEELHGHDVRDCAEEGNVLVRVFPANVIDDHDAKEDVQHDEVRCAP